MIKSPNIRKFAEQTRNKKHKIYGFDIINSNFSH